MSQVLCVHGQHLVETSLPRSSEEPLPRVKTGETEDRVTLLCHAHVQKWAEQDRETCNIVSSCNVGKMFRPLEGRNCSGLGWVFCLGSNKVKIKIL